VFIVAWAKELRVAAAKKSATIQRQTTEGDFDFRAIRIMICPEETWIKGKTAHGTPWRFRSGLL
jgi:hypothetical protein